MFTAIPHGNIEPNRNDISVKNFHQALFALAFDDHDLREQCCQRVALEAENETVAVVSQCLHPFLIHAGPSGQVHSWRPSRKTAQC